MRYVVFCGNRTRTAGRCVCLLFFLPLFLLAGLSQVPSASAADLEEAEQLYLTGDYEACVEMASEAIASRLFGESWRVLKIQAEMELGRYAAARETLEQALERYAKSIRLRWIGADVLRFNDKPQEARKLQDEIAQLVTSEGWRYRDAANRVVIGRYLLTKGIDPKDILEQVFDQVQREAPEYAEGYLATGQLALEKHDNALAAEVFQKGLEQIEDDPRIYFGLSQAFASSDAERAEQALQETLQRNPRYVPALLQLVEDRVDAELYDEAERLLEKVRAINPHEPRAHAYAAVLAHLANDAEREEELRSRALQHWSTNPAVDHWIGRKLSQKYRFAEGAAYQRLALKLDPQYLPAQMQLSQDLLRLGEEEEGWQLADEVYERDAYNVVAHNLLMLRDHLQGFATRNHDGFVLRMSTDEMQIYGDRVCDLLSRAKEVLVQKYDVQLDEPVLVELFPRQADFAIRTFGLPGGAGFLGVCFGRVITANSPASQGDTPSNWEAVLWHEFCHVVTLTKTKNKMPRWLSEGISVYEERLANPSWGQMMTPRYREMILKGELTPVSQLSGAFLKPESPLHLQFAYFEAALVVEYLVEEYGLDVLKRVLVDLSVGMPINESLQRYTGSIDQLDQEFEAFARQQAETWSSPADFTPVPEELELDVAAVQAWNEAHANNIPGLVLEARLRTRQGQWEAAKQPLQQWIRLVPQQSGADSGYALLAEVHRQLGETNAERAVLEEMVKWDSDSVAARRRLLEILRTQGNWQVALKYADQLMAINPLLPSGHRVLAEAAESIEDDATLRKALEALLVLDPFDPADLHYRLASALARQDRWPEARRHILRSLEEAPRYRAALRLLLEIHARNESTAATNEQLPEERPASQRAVDEATPPMPSIPASAGGSSRPVQEVSP